MDKFIKLIPTLNLRNSTQRTLPTNEIAKVPRHGFLAKVNRPGLSPFPRRQIPPSSKLDVELGVAESKMVKKMTINIYFCIFIYKFLYIFADFN